MASSRCSHYASVVFLWLVKGNTRFLCLIVFAICDAKEVELRCLRCALVGFEVISALHESCCGSLDYLKSFEIMDKMTDALSPEMSPSTAPQPYFPLLAPSPLAPFTNNTVPKLSRLCMLNFAAVESMMRMTSIDCIAVFTPFLANVICCPQLEATLVVLIGQSRKDTNLLALNNTLANHCLSNFEQILVGQVAINDVNEFESTVDSSMLLAACKKIDTVNECCDQICQNTISEAARKLALKAYDLLGMDWSYAFSDHSTRVSDCEVIVHRWLASKLDPSRAKDVLRGLSNCNVNKVCPLVFPNVSNVSKGCGNEITNQTACCNAMENYVSRLQKRSFITNLQAVNCAASLGMKLQKVNITENVYNLYRISLKDLSLQAPWPSGFQIPSLCNKTVKIPALTAATSGQSGLHGEDFMFHLLFATWVVLMIVL
ncbi:putative GPI-anchored protein [Camellia lanceoleosa]|uniref:GPI-anchored protein n=1 Tax=Camellia lanceoleosa TaxID=1840588 RepID=A0ACC0GJB5_9ERIC|nr:putative GPI-anchored protein [Camellia lanceoleosa]